MEGMQKISEAVLVKIAADARKIVEEAEQKRLDEITRAKKLREDRHQEERLRMTEEAEREAARIISDALAQSRRALLETETAIVNDIVGEARSVLSGRPTGRDSLAHIMREAVAGMGQAKVRIYVTPRDLDAARAIVQDDPSLAASVIEVRERDFLGGAIAESTDGRVKVDNTYETRLEMLVPRLLPTISREMFGPGS